MVDELTSLDPAPLTVALKTASTLSIDSKADTPRDRSADLDELKATSLIEQRNTLIKAMVQLFIGLNGGVYVLTLAAWAFGFWFQHDQIVTEKVLMALIGATVVQAGIAFVAITRFLFPSVKDDAGGR